MSPATTTEAAHAPNFHDLSEVARPLWRDPRVLAKDWRAPALIGRETILARLETSVFSGLAPGGRIAVSISGPRGAGTSSVAAHLVATAKLRLTHPGSKGEPLVLRVDLSEVRSPASLVTSIFRQIQPDFPGKGASAEFLTLLLARRIRTLGRSTIVWLDQVRGPEEFARVAQALAQPERLLPEGTAGLPAMLLVVSGDHDLLPEVDAVRTQLQPLQGRELVQAILNRAALAFNFGPSPSEEFSSGSVLPREPCPSDGEGSWGSLGAPPSLEAAHAIANLVVARGWGLSAVGEVLAEAGRRAEARGGRWLEVEDVALPAHLPRATRDASAFEEVLLDVLRGNRSPLAIGTLRRALAARCADAGLRAPTQARLWRHLVRMERRGVITRSVRLGGRGGSSTQVSLASPDTASTFPEDADVSEHP